MQKQARRQAAATSLQRALAADPDLQKHALAFAGRRLAARGYPAATRDVTPEDLLHDVVEAVLSGRRAAPPNWSRNEIQSLINSVLWAKRHRKAGGIVLLLADLVDATDEVASTDDAVARREHARYQRAVITLFREQIGHDAELLLFADAILAGAVKRAEIAAFLGVEPSRVTNLQKRFDRRARDFRSKRRRQTSVDEEVQPGLKDALAPSRSNRKQHAI